MEVGRQGAGAVVVGLRVPASTTGHQPTALPTQARVQGSGCTRLPAAQLHAPAQPSCSPPAETHVASGSSSTGWRQQSQMAANQM